MARLSIFVIISVIVTLFYLFGLLKFLTDVGDDKCEMTYMYEYPQFIRVANNIDKKYPKYGLYAYGEGRLTSRVRNMYFDGIPVLFIPGNAGSHKQVRSLSSVALRKALNGNTVHFDYFTLDLNDEFSGLYGPLLYDHLDYANHSFYRIFNLYKEKQKPNSIILIGHSMGGIIAKKLLSQLPGSNLVPILITLASPLKRAPLILDYHLRSFYELPSSEISFTTTVINLSGGYRDFLVPTFLSEVKNSTDINVVTSNIPMTWIENNHVQILWCKQLILAITRALFDSVDPETNSISTNFTNRRIVFNHHLSQHSGIKIKNLPQYSELIKLDFKGKWIESLYKQYTVEHLKGVREPHWYMVKLTTLPGHDILNVLALNLEIVNWVYTCNANFLRGSSRLCGEAYQLTHLSEIAPSMKYKRRFIQINLREVYRNHTELTHVVFRTLQTDEPIVFHVDIHSEAERVVNVELPKWWSRKRQTIVGHTPEKALNLRVLLPDLQNVVQHYDLFVEPQQCSKENHHASMTLVTPWAEEDRHAFFTSTETKPFDLRLYSTKPGNFSEVPYLKFILDPSCTYEISVRYSSIGSLGQIARFYTPFLLTNVAVVILLAFKCQLVTLKQGHFPIIFTAMINGSRGYYLLILARILTQPLKYWEANVTNYIPKPDIWYIIDDGLDFIIIPFFLYFCSVGIVWILSIIYGISLFTLESTANKVALKLLTRPFIWSNYLMTFLHKVPAIVAAILIFLSLTTCGGLALCLGTVFYFLRLTQMSQDYVEDVCWYVVKKFGWKFLRAFFRRSQGNTSNQNRKHQNNSAHGTKSNENKIAKHVKKSVDKETDDNIEQNEPGDGSEQKEDQIKTGDEEIAKTETTEIDKVEDQLENESKLIDVTESSAEILEKTPEDDTTAPDITDDCEAPENEPQPEDNSGLSSDYNCIFFHSTIFFLWCIVTLINIPAVLTWAHNFKFHKYLSPDDSFVPAIALSLCALPLWQLEFPREKKRGLDALGVVITIVSLLCLMFATVSVYRLNYLLTFVIVLVTLHQLVPHETSVEGENGKDGRDIIKSKYEDIKKKVD